MLLKKSLLTIFLVLLADQVLKFWVKTHMSLGQEYNLLGNWFIIHFTENEGMAFGMKFGGSYGKLILTLFRIIAVSAIGYYLYTLIKAQAKTILVVCISLIFAGAMGNILDSVYYGLIFGDSYFTVAQFMPQGGGYGTFLHGKVVDMFYFPILTGIYPSWVPFLGGEGYQFFRPVFNTADASISIGVTMLILFQGYLFDKAVMTETPETTTNEGEESTHSLSSEEDEKAL